MTDLFALEARAAAATDVLHRLGHHPEAEHQDERHDDAPARTYGVGLSRHTRNPRPTRGAASPGPLAVATDQRVLGKVSDYEYNAARRLRLPRDGR